MLELIFESFSAPQCCLCGEMWPAGRTTGPTTTWSGKKHESGANRDTRTWWPSRTRRRSSTSTEVFQRVTTTTGSGFVRSTTSGRGWEPTSPWPPKPPTGQRGNPTTGMTAPKKVNLRTAWRFTSKGRSRRGSGMTRDAPRKRQLCAIQVRNEFLTL